MNEIEQLYFSWLCSLVKCKEKDKRLLEYLYFRSFYSTLPMDTNREDDGVNLRYKFGKIKHIDERLIATELDTKPCSILELMIALAFRLEDSIMSDPDIGDRTGEWFWEMIRSLGLDLDHFDIHEINDILYKFLERKYEPNGKGGLFTLKNPREDLRNVEIWYQANWYLTEIIYDGRT